MVMIGRAGARLCRGSGELRHVRQAAKCRSLGFSILRPALQAEEPAAREPGWGDGETGIAEWMPDACQGAIVLR
jgi:hypothetical protein